MQDGALIVGIGETQVGKLYGRSSLGLQAEAVIRAVADAGLERSDVDALYAIPPYSTGGIMHALGLAEYLGLRPKVEVTYDVGGTVSFLGMVLGAIAAIGEGRAQVAVCAFGENASTRRVSGSHGLDMRTVQFGAEDFEVPFGAAIPVVWYALAAQRYLGQYQLKAEDVFFPMACSMRKNASLNENAAYRKPFTREEYLAAPIMAEPLRRLDCAPVVDGAGAFVVASKRFARSKGLKHAPISVLSVGMQATHKAITQMPNLEELGMTAAGQQAFAEAGLSHSDVDLVTIHDAFSISIALDLEALGFCSPGDAGKFAAEGALEITGELPTNTHGGLMSQGHVGGVLHVVEAVRQLRREAGCRQVKNAEIAAVAGNGNIFSTCGVMLLGRGE